VELDKDFCIHENKVKIGSIDGILKMKSCIDYTGDYIDNAIVGYATFGCFVQDI